MEDYPYMINQKKQQGWIKKFISYAYGIKGFLSKHPGPQPISLTRAHFSTIRTNQYLVAEKSDGIRCLLVIGKLGKTPYAAFVDRTMKMYQLQIRAPADYFRGTLLDGEVIHHGGELTFVAFDVVCIRGKPLQNLNFLQRYEICHKLDISFRPHTMHPKINMLFKPFFQWATHFGSLTRTPSKLPADGYILMPVDGPPVPFTQTNLFKWKPVPTVDLVMGGDGKLQWFNKIKRAPENIQFDHPHDVTSIQAMNLSVGLVVEFSVDWCFSTSRYILTFRKIRQDKTAPNTAETVLGVLQAVIDKISLSELVQQQPASSLSSSCLDSIIPKTFGSHRL